MPFQAMISRNTHVQIIMKGLFTGIIVITIALNGVVRKGCRNWVCSGSAVNSDTTEPEFRRYSM